MSFLKSKHSGWLSDGTRTPFSGGGSGGGGGPTQTTSYNTNIPEYARPYVENMLQSAQSQVYNDDMTSFRGYNPYSSDVNNYFAGFSPLQQSAQESAYYMQSPGQFGLASGLAGASGIGALGAQGQSSYLGSEALGYGQAGSMYGGLGAQQAIDAAQRTGMQAGMYGGLGAGYGSRGAQAAEQGYGAGAQFAQQATDPNAVRAYMSPYMQNVVDYQKSQAARDFGMAQTARQAQAVAKGAFGGSRQAIENAEAQRNLMSQLQGIEATGSQKAFEDAQRQQQFGANLGLQGLQAGYQGTGMGIQGAQTGLQGVGQQLGAGQLGLQGTAQGIQGAQAGLQGVGQAVGAGQYGLAGLGQATQAAGTLGQLGTQQFGTEKDIINLQSTMGAQQQALEQNKINQAIQDYAIQQQYPMMQLGFLSNMLRGLPMQSQTTQLYQAQPSALQQGIGLAGAGASLLGAGVGRAEGGVIKMAEGGIADYKYGGAIPEPKLESMADSLSVAQLQERIKDPALTPGERQIFQEALAAKQQVAARSSGIAAAGGGLFNTMGYAGGGILAFADEGLVDSGIDPETGEPYKKVNPITRFSEYMNPFSGKGGFGYIARDGKSIEEYYNERSKAPPATEADRKAQAQMEVQDIEGSSAKAPTIKSAAAQNVDNKPSKAPSAQANETSGIGAILAGLRKEGPKGELGSDYLKRLQDLESGADKRLSRADKIAMAKGFLKFGATPAPGGIGQAAIAGLGEYTEGYGKALESDEKFRMENAKLQSDIQNLRRAEERGDVKLAAELQEKIADRANRLQTANISAAASGRTGAREDAYVKQLMAQGMSLEQALQAVKGAGKAESNDINRAKAALAQINEELLLLKKDDPRRATLMAQREQITKSLTSGGSMQTSGGGAPTFRFDANGNLVKG
jgi:hypothetical protein